MKYLLISILSISGYFCRAQIPNGTYESSNESYRANYFLSINDEEVTLFGWETTVENDTIYFRSTTRFNSNNHLTFNEFEFQKEEITGKNLNTFEADNNLKMEPFFIHRYFMDLKESNGQISLIATKDAYDNRADAFNFKKIVQTVHNKK